MSERTLRIANSRAAAVWTKVGEELGCDDEDLQMLRIAASRRHGHATGLWAPGFPVPAEDKQDWLVLAAFETSPYGPDEQGDEYCFGDVRVFVAAPGDMLGAARGLLGADLPSLSFAVYQLRGSGAFTMSPLTEEGLVEALSEECRRVMAAVGAGGGEGEDDDANDRTCESCHADTRAWTDPDPGNDEADKDLAVPKFCGNCGAMIPIKAEVVEP